MRPEEQVQQEAFSFALPPCHPFENQEWAHLPMQTSATAIKFPFSTCMHPPLPYLAISAPVFCWSWFVLPARAASASFRQALSPTWEGAAGNKGQAYLFARQNSQAAPPPQHSTLIEALQALKDGSYKHYFSSVCEPPLKATEMKSSLWQKILFWYTCIRKTFIWRWHRISAKVCLLIQVGYQKPQRKTHSWRHLFSVHIPAFADLILPRKKNVTKKKNTCRSHHCTR